MSAPVFLITGAMAAGKSTIAKALVQRLPRSAYVAGDVFRRMIINGSAVMGPVLDIEARHQLTLRQEISTDVVRRYHSAGFAVVYQDILIGRDLTNAVDRLADLDPKVVVLSPSVDVLALRDRDRPKTGYSAGFPPSVLANALASETPKIGTWIDNSCMTVKEVVERILALA